MTNQGHVRDRSNSKPLPHAVYQHGWVGESQGDNPKRICSGYAGPSNYKSSVTKQQQTWHRTATSWAPAMARKRKESPQKALSSSAFPGCHNCSSNLDTAHPRHHNALADTQQAEKCLPSHPKVTSNPFSRSLRLSRDLSRLKIKPVFLTRQGRPGSCTTVLKAFGAAAPQRGVRLFFYFR